jgi:hypothetical protein
MAKTKPIAIRRIRQTELESFQIASAKVDGLRRALKQAEEELEGAQDAIKIKIEERWEFEAGQWTARIDIKERKVPAWKAVVLERCGQLVVDHVIANCAPSISKKVVVVRAIEL